MEIERINTYSDDRFSQDVLLEHGAFLVDGYRPCSFKIQDECSAMVFFDDYSIIIQIIEEFRFYAEHITVFYDTTGAKIAELPPIHANTLSIDRIQPSQFYVDSDKVQAISTFVTVERDIIIPVVYDKRIDKYVSLDGHTRLYYAYTKGWHSVRVFESHSDDDIFFFVDEARQRGIFSPKELSILSHKEYVQKWDKFCDDYFAKKV